MRNSAVFVVFGLGVLNAGFFSSCEPTRELEMGRNARALVLGDVNGDGRTDLLVASVGESASTGLEPEQLLVRLGTGRGVFGEIARNAGPDIPVDLFLADIDADTVLDVVSPVSYGTVRTFLGVADGSFLSGPIASPCDTRSPGGTSGDFDGDAASDVAVLCRGDGSNYLVTLFSRPGPVLERGQSIGASPLLVAPNAVASGDLNGDSDIDLVVVGGYGGDASAIPLMNDGTGRFTSLAPVPAPDAAVALADMDGDAVLDAVTAGGALAILTGNGDGTFAAARTVFTGEPLARLAVSDLDADGVPDIATLGAELNVFIAMKSGEFERRTPSAGENPIDLAIADFDDDGWGDLAVLNAGAPSSVTVHFDVARRSRIPRPAR
jgi:hypothetical protein